jgi:hypothetical protein
MLVALILNVITIVSFPALLTMAKQSVGGDEINGLFWGSEPYNDGSTAFFGPNVGYFLQFVALAFILGGILAIRRYSKSERQVDSEPTG